MKIQIIGGPGSGKSFLAEVLSRKICRRFSTDLFRADAGAVYREIHKDRLSHFCEEGCFGK